MTYWYNSKHAQIHKDKEGHTPICTPTHTLLQITNLSKSPYSDKLLLINTFAVFNRSLEVTGINDLIWGKRKVTRTSVIADTGSEIISGM